MYIIFFLVYFAYSTWQWICGIYKARGARDHPARLDNAWAGRGRVFYQRPRPLLLILNAFYLFYLYTRLHCRTKYGCGWQFGWGSACCAFLPVCMMMARLASVILVLVCDQSLAQISCSTTPPSTLTTVPPVYSNDPFLWNPSNSKSEVITF